MADKVQSYVVNLQELHKRQVSFPFDLDLQSTKAIIRSIKSSGNCENVHKLTNSEMVYKPNKHNEMKTNFNNNEKNLKNSANVSTVCCSIC